MIDQLVELILQLNQLLGGNLGITLIVIGIATRGLFTPLFLHQMKHNRKMRELQPEIDKLKKKYKNDKEGLAKAQTELFREAGVNPMAGCLPMLVQFIVFALLYRAILSFLGRDIQTQFLWWDMTQPDLISVQLPIISHQAVRLPGVLVISAAAAQLLMSKLMMPKPVAIEPEDKPKEEEAKVDLMADIQRSQSQMVYLFPLMFLFFGYQFPSGIVLYWLVTTLMTLAQQLYFRRQPGPAIQTPTNKDKQS